MAEQQWTVQAVHENGPDDDRLLLQAAELLESEWPRAGHVSKLRRSCDAWPIHYALVRQVDGSVIGHGCLQSVPSTPSSPVADSGILYSLVIDKSLRGQGAGAWLLERLEDVARTRGCKYLVLSTDDAAGFYSKCGYAKYAGTLAVAPVLQKVGPTSALEAMLKRKAVAASDAAEPVGTTWMRKRLLGFNGPDTVKEVGPTALAAAMHRHNNTADHAATSPASAAPATAATHTEASSLTLAALSSATSLLRWRPQIGPSCGVTALLCVADTVLGRGRGRGQAGTAAAGHDGQEAKAAAGALAAPLPEATLSALQATVSHPTPRLLAPLLSTGASRDGEVFDLHALAAVGREALGLRVEVLALPAGDAASDAATTTAAAESAIGRTLAAGGYVLVAADEDGGDGHTPCCMGGARAHWYVVSGLLAGDGQGMTLVVLQHTLSPSPVVATLASLLRSNAQLRPAATLSERARAEGWVVAPVAGAQAWQEWRLGGQAPTPAAGDEGAGRAANGLSGLILLTPPVYTGGTNVA